MPRVSVIMPSYNHARFVGAAIESVLAQTMADFELIIVDDGSKDDSREIIAGYKDPRITFLPFEKNRGAYTAINDALKLARGDFIAHLNSDDRFLPDKLERQLAVLEANPQIGICFSVIEVIDEHGRIVPDNQYLQVFRLMNGGRHDWLRLFFVSNCLCHPTMLARRTVMDRAGPYDDRYRQMADLDLWVRIAMFAEIHVMDRPTLQFRDHGLNTGGRTLAARNRSGEERRFINERYYSITDLKELYRIFPDLAKTVPHPAPGTSEFLVALAALKLSRTQYNILAIEKLFRLMADPEQRKLLEAAYGFTMATMHDFIGRIDSYNSQIHTGIALGGLRGGKIERLADTYLVGDAIDVRLPVPAGPAVDGYAIQLMNDPSVLEIARLAFVTATGEEVPVTDWRCNARPAADRLGVMHFPVYPAQIDIPLAGVPANLAGFRIVGKRLSSGAEAVERCLDAVEAAARATTAGA